MTITNLTNSNMMNKIYTQKENTAQTQNVVVQTPVKMQMSSGIGNSLSSRYTMAVGQDGRRYVLQLRIDIANIGSFVARA